MITKNLETVREGTAASNLPCFFLQLIWKCELTKLNFFYVFVKMCHLVLEKDTAKLRLTQR